MSLTIINPDLIEANEERSPFTYYTIQRIIFSFRQSNVYGYGWGEIDAYVFIQNRPMPEPIATGIGCPLSDWQDYEQPQPGPSGSELVKRVFSYERQLLTAAKTLFDRNSPITSASLVAEIVRRRTQDQSSLQTVFALYISDQQKSPESLMDCKRQWQLITAYLKHIQTPDFPLGEVDAPFVEKVYKYLRNIGATHSIAIECVKLLGDIHRWAINYPFTLAPMPRHD